MAPNRPVVPWTSDPSLVDRAAWTGNLRRASWVWALAPLATCGLGNVPVFLYAAIRQRRRSWWYAFGGYAAATVSMFSLTNAIEDSAQDNIQTILIMTNWVVGAGHALATRQRVFQPPATLDLGNDPVLAAAVHAQGRRDLARNILAQDPRLASDLGIGRPDLGRGYDDGGLVDANTAPAAVLARLPALGPSLASQVVTVRDSAGGFSSAEEMAILTDLPPHVVDQVRDRLVFSPR